MNLSCPVELQPTGWHRTSRIHVKVIFMPMTTATTSLQSLVNAKAALDLGLLTAEDYGRVKEAFLKAQELRAGIDAGLIEEGAQVAQAREGFVGMVLSQRSNETGSRAVAPKAAASVVHPPPPLPTAAATSKAPAPPPPPVPPKAPPSAPPATSNGSHGSCGARAALGELCHNVAKILPVCFAGQGPQALDRQRRHVHVWYFDQPRRGASFLSDASEVDLSVGGV